MATRHSNKLSLEYRGGKIQFGLHQPTGQYRKKFKGCTLYLGADPETVLEQWLAKTELVEAELSAANKGKHNLISKGFLDLTNTTGIRRENLTFYSMRHTFQTQRSNSTQCLRCNLIGL